MSAPERELLELRQRNTLLEEDNKRMKRNAAIAASQLAEAQATRDRKINEKIAEVLDRKAAEAERDRLAADNARLTKERDKERKHVARLMRDLDHNRNRAEAAEARIRAMEVKP